ncbi:YciI family protein [Lacicoccus alkaliphilus]|uniref:YCII-related domain-containing protein n=1 Tax=Lacicoccus alkaliphilus DSM 16010 TaxID=1123231 RepID=A0A1M7BRN6_9BACL|nr:YciI family protein [Salinicoccus alkaliphilus]SHL57695.1 YCII-related domain-containing protein [Salinicoccus alkaliphilus DSM 16010]
MKYFAVFLPMKDEEKSKAYREEHLKFLEGLREKDVIIMNGRFTDGAGGLVIYKGEHDEEVEKLVKQDPYVINGARGYEMHEWEMVTNYEI